MNPESSQNGEQEEASIAASSGGAIAATFRRLQGVGRCAFLPYITAGDPDLATTAEIMLGLVAAGADLLGLGVPFSDPIAEGPTQQRASGRALQAGATLSAILDLVARQRQHVGVPIVLYSYFNPIHARGVEVFAEEAASAGIDGVLCVDLPPEEGGELTDALRAHGLDTVSLVSATSTRPRIKKLVQAATGFVYYVLPPGLPSEPHVLSRELVADVKRLRRRLRLPLVVGLGPSRYGILPTEQIAAVAKIADGVVVASALVQVMEENAGQSNLASLVEQRARELSAPLHEKSKK